MLGALALRSADLFCVAGILLFAVAFFALAEKPEDRLAFGLVGTAFFLILFTQRLFIYDRMNTFFKLYLECWLLLRGRDGGPRLPPGASGAAPCRAGRRR